MNELAYDRSVQRTAIAASIAYLVSFATVAFVEFGIHEPLIVAGRPAETAANILAHQGRFHLSIALDAVYCLGTLVVIGAYYVILERFGRMIALVSALARFVFDATWILALIRLADALRMLQGAEYLNALGPERLQPLAALRLSGRFDDYYIGLPFWAISATLLAYLWLKSRYIPRPLATAGVAASAWAIFCSFAYLTAPGFANFVNTWWFDSPMVLFELAVAVWILVKGLNRSESTDAADAPDGRPGIRGYELPQAGRATTRSPV